MEEGQPTQTGIPVEPQFYLHLDSGFTGISYPLWSGVGSLQVSARARCGRGVLSGWFLPPPGVIMAGLRLRGKNGKHVAQRKQFRPDAMHCFPGRSEAMQSGFRVELSLKTGWNEFALEYKDAELGWKPAGRLRLRLPALWWLKRRGPEVPGHDASYHEWVLKQEACNAAGLPGLRDWAGSLTNPPLLSVVMPVCDPPPEWLRQALESVRTQAWSGWELVLVDEACRDSRVRRLLAKAVRDSRVRLVRRAGRGGISRATNDGIAAARGSFVVLLDHDDLLAPHALGMIAREILTHPDAGVIFSDEDKTDDRGRRHGPYFKGGWDPDRILQENCVSHLGAYRTELVREAGGLRPAFDGSQDWDLLLRCAERLRPEQIRHIPAFLYHWRVWSGSTSHSMAAKPYALEAGRRAVAEHLARTAPAARVVPLTTPGPAWRIEWPLPGPALLASLIMLTRDRLDLLKPAVESLLATAQGVTFELILVDHETRETEALQWMEDLCRREPRVRKLRLTGAFNWSRLNNEGAAAARGEVLIFLNNDLIFHDAGWLRELVSQASRPEVGAVGACLEFPDGRLQHAGIVLGLGHAIAGHAHRGWRLDAPTIAGQLNLVRNVTALTGACLATRRSVFESAGGFDAEHFPVNWNDVDYCLRLRAAGRRILWTPYARVTHFESMSRAVTGASAEAKAAATREGQHFLAKWGQPELRDPFWNPALSLALEIPVEGTPLPLGFP